MTISSDFHVEDTVLQNFEIFSKTLGTVIMPILQVRKPMLGRIYVNQDLNPGIVSPDPELPALLQNRGYGTCSVTTQL